MMLGRLGRETAEYDALDAQCRGDVSLVGEFRGYDSNRIASRAVGREPIDAGRNGRKCDRYDVVLGGNHHRISITAHQQLIFILVAAPPDRADRVDDMPGLE